MRLFQMYKNLYRNFSDVATVLYGGLSNPYATSRTLQASQMMNNIRQR